MASFSHIGFHTLLLVALACGDHIQVPPGYDKNAAPASVSCSGEPTMVRAELYINKVHTINEQASTVNLEGYFRRMCCESNHSQ